MGDFPCSFFCPEPGIVSVELFGHPSHQSRHQGLGWDHLSCQVQSCHTAVLLSAPQGLAPRPLCIFGAHLCLAGFTGVKIPALINPHWHTLLSCWLEFVPKAMCKCCVRSYKTQSDQGRWPGYGKLVTRTAELSWTLCSEVTKDSLLEEHTITHLPSKSVPARVAGFWMEKCMESGYMKAIQGGEKQANPCKPCTVSLVPECWLLL